MQRQNETAAATFERDGALFPIRVFDPAESAGLRVRYEELQQRDGAGLSGRNNKKPHLLVPWLNHLVKNDDILRVVTSLLGPDVLCWSSMFFDKAAGDGTYVAWHQDATYWGLSKPDIVTAWVAFTPSTPTSGCLRVVLGSHHQEQLPHRLTDDGKNMLSRSQELAVEVRDEDATDVVLQPGEMSIHHVKLIHGSGPNRADHPRVGYAIRYIAAEVKQLTSFRDSATLVAGRDHGNFDPEPAPQADFHPEAVAFHDAMLRRQAEIQGAI